jgi:hypothetical protein
MLNWALKLCHKGTLLVIVSAAEQLPQEVALLLLAESF